MKWRLDKGQIEVVDDRIAEILRQETLTERVQMIFAANRTMRLVIEGALRTQHPEWTDDEVLAEVARRMLGEADCKRKRAHQEKGSD